MPAELATRCKNPKCGNPVERQSERGRIPDYCSTACRRVVYDARKYDEVRRARIEEKAARPVHHYLSLGGGVNSVALMLWLLDHGIEHEAVYADLGSDYPETRVYVEMLRGKGYPVTILDTRRAGKTLTEWCLHYGVMPSRMMRWCTSAWKVEPLARYFVRPAIVYIGIDAGEFWRAKPMGTREIEYQYPLIEEGIDRDGCKRLIEGHGLPVPAKSHCFVCPFQLKRDFVTLYKQHPELYEQVKQIEEVTNARLQRLGQPPRYLKDKPLDVLVGAHVGYDQRDMFEGSDEFSLERCQWCEV